MSIHLPECPQHCPYPDLTYIAPGASLPKCRGGDCTLCDEVDCICDALRSAMVRVINTGAGAAADIEFGRQEGLREAHDAVAALMNVKAARHYYGGVHDAVAAIDKLRGTP